MKKNALVLYGKLPVSGKVKTRLTKNHNDALTKEEACDFYEALLSDIIAHFSENQRVYDFFICIKDKADEFKDKFAGKYQLIGDFGGGDLGLSMRATIGNLKEMGYDNVIIIGSDVPSLSRKIVEDVFKLMTNDSHLVLGPDQSGGCYLIAGNSPFDIFKDIEWSAGKDFEILQKKAATNNIAVSILDEELDIDTMEDFITFSKVGIKTLAKEKLPKTHNFLKMFHVKHSE